MKDLKVFFRIYWGEIILMTIIAVLFYLIVLKK